MKNNKIKWAVIGCFFIVIVAGLIFWGYRNQKKDYYEVLTMTGATPLAVTARIPDRFSLTVDGLVKKTYHFTGSSLNAFALTRIRTREITPEGKYLGAYIHLGIPVFNILEGIAPQKPKDVAFNQPLDMMVTFTSSSGKQVRFSYNEILMTDDRYPVTLAFSRKPLRPTSDSVKDTYSNNVYMDELNGFRVISPREPDNSRYLDDVVRVTFSVPDYPDDPLPVREKGKKCLSTELICIEDGRQWPARLDDVAILTNEKWVRIGHGHGYDETAHAQGLSLRDFLRKNFPNCRDDDFFLFAACDGYRCLFSGREIFNTSDGAMMMVLQKLNGRIPENGLMLAATADYFVDRSMWGAAYVVRVPMEL